VALYTLTIFAALLGPLYYLPSLRRMLVGRTTDGVSTTLCGVGLLSYGTWLGLAAGVSYGFYGVLLASSCLALLQAVLAVRYSSGSPIRMLLWFLSGVGSCLVALRWPWLAVIYIAPLDLVWYGRAIRDVLRSVAAKAVSVWGWVMSTTANLAWVVEAAVEGNTPFMLQSVLLTCASMGVIVATIKVRRRVRADRGAQRTEPPGLRPDNPGGGFRATPGLRLARARSKRTAPRVRIAIIDADCAGPTYPRDVVRHLVAGDAVVIPVDVASLALDVTDRAPRVLASGVPLEVDVVLTRKVALFDVLVAPALELLERSGTWVCNPTAAASTAIPDRPCESVCLPVGSE